jgi:hypothetical protein
MDTAGFEVLTELRVDLVERLLLLLEGDNLSVSFLDLPAPNLIGILCILETLDQVVVLDHFALGVLLDVLALSPVLLIKETDFGSCLLEINEFILGLLDG